MGNKENSIPLHKTVMGREVLDILKCGPGKIYLDCTLGDGGHSEIILMSSSPNGRLIAIDQDYEAIARAERRLKPFEGRFLVFKENFANIDIVVNTNQLSGFDGIVFDLGVSSYQLSKAERGFSFTHEGNLDMRMDTDNPVTAFDLVNKLAEKELADIIYNFGDEPFSRKIARAICQARKFAPIRTTTELGNIVHSAKRKKSGGSIRSETKTFQALRIAVNKELNVLRNGLDKAIGSLMPHGRLCVITFHSIEDRIVKQTFREKVKNEKGRFLLITPKPLVPSQDEKIQNPRCRSAKLRAIEKLPAPTDTAT